MSLLDIDNLDEDLAEDDPGHIEEHEKIARGMKTLKTLVGPGQELEAAKRLSQFSWSGTDWMDVEGLQITLASPVNGPMYLEASLGLVVVNGTTDAGLYCRITDSTDQTIAFGSLSVPGNAQGYNSNTYAPIKGRVAAGVSERKYRVQVQNLNGQLSYIIPEWLPGAVGDLRAVAA